MYLIGCNKDLMANSWVGSRGQNFREAGWEAGTGRRNETREMCHVETEVNDGPKWSRDVELVT